MILVRNVFQLKFGKAKEATTLWKEGTAMLKKAGVSSTRVLIDLVGPFYTLVLENSFNSLADFESFHKTHGGNEDWKKWYEKFSALVESGHREIFTIVE